MSLKKVDLYLPKGKDHEDKLRNLEKRLVLEQRDQVVQQRNENKAKD